VVGTQAQAQVKDMPSQAEFDPILENADEKMRSLFATLTEFRTEAVSMDRERYDEDLKSLGELRKLIQVTRTDGSHDVTKGINMGRLVIILTTVDDLTLEAATWKNGAELQMCQLLIQHKDPSRYDQFSTRLAMNLVALREVGRQLSNPITRMADAMDKIILAVLHATSKGQPKPQ
jgi:hypothetical protein